MSRFPLVRNNITREDLDAVITHLQQDDPILTNGPEIRAFEAEWSAWLGVEHSVFVNSGSSANLLSMSLLQLDHPDGGEIIVPPLTWVSDIASVLQTGFTPVFADINPRTLAMDTDAILACITERTRAVFLSHIQGFNGLTDRLLTALSDSGIPLIEDVCESHGASHNGRRLGSYGATSNFSFYYAHHMSTIEGGMVCTNDAAIYEKLRMLRSHGMVRESRDTAVKAHYETNYPDLNPQFIFAFPAFNMRNNEIGGILGRAQLKRLDQIVTQRNENQSYFFENIDGAKYSKDFDFEGCSNYAFNLVLREPDRALMERLEATLQDNGVEFRRGSAGGGNQLRQPYLENRFAPDVYDSCPNADHIHFFGMYIGNFPELPREDIDYICALINGA